MEDKSDLSWKEIVITIGLGVIVIVLIRFAMQLLGIEVNYFVFGGVAGLLVGGKLGWSVRKARIERMKEESK